MKYVIRPENPADFQIIYKLNERAFGQSAESDLINRLRASASYIAELSLVAEHEGQVVGHILFTRNHILQANENQIPSLALAPMAVHPDFQRKGMGSQLVKEGLKQAKAMGFTSVIVLGHPQYYPKFGFQAASNWQITTHYDVPDDVFMALELVPGSLSNSAGKVVYDKAFDETK